MSILDLLENSPDQLKGKHVQQIISFAGEGEFRDGSLASAEFREYLRNVGSLELGDYAGNCFSSSFPGCGFALQDVVNEVGRRLGFSVENGRYRGTSSDLGFDGVWRVAGENEIVVEVKTTDTYRIELDRIADYRRELVRQTVMNQERSSILIVVGRQDTGDLEAQIRGSKHAWDVRLISVEALLRLVSIREEVEDPGIARRIRSILEPREYTRVDEIIDLMFSAKEEILEEVVPEEARGDHEGTGEMDEKKFTPVSFHDACIERISKNLGRNLVKQSRATFESADGTVAVVCAVSREYERRSHPIYWFAFHPHQKLKLEAAKTSYVAFGCGSEERLLFIPFDSFSPLLPKLNQTHRDDGRSYWHVHIHRDGGRLVLYPKAGEDRIDLTRYLLVASR